MRVLLTGSSGWLGRHLAPLLRAAGHEVVGLDVARGAETDVVGSVADRVVVDRAMGGIDAVIHAGALHKPDIARYPNRAFLDVNVTGTLNLLEAAAHLRALERAPEIGFGTYIVSAPTPFARGDAPALKADAAKVIARYFPDAPALYAERGWELPTSIGRVYDSGAIERDLGFRCATDFHAILEALRIRAPLPFAHDPAYVSPALLPAGAA